jgi:hypothetical protein
MLRAAHFVALISVLSNAQAQTGVVPPIHGSMTLREFAIVCQHPGHKSNPAARLAACAAWVEEAKNGAAKARGSVACRAALDGTGPYLIADLLFYMALSPDTPKEMRLAGGTAEALWVAAPKCR